MTRRVEKILKILKSIAENPDIMLGSLKKLTKYDITIQKYKEFLADLEKSNYITCKKNENDLSFYSITEVGKDWIAKNMPKKRSLQDFPGDCQVCGKYSTRLSLFRGDSQCPDCLNHDKYKEPPFKNKSSICECRDYQ